MAIGITLLIIQLISVLECQIEPASKLRRIMVIHLLAGFGVHTARTFTPVVYIRSCSLEQWL